MDLALNIRGDGSGGSDAFKDVAGDAQASAKVIEDAFASMAKKTDAAFKKMEQEAKRSADTIAAANKKVGDAHHEQLVQQQADYLESRKKAEEMWAAVGKAAMVAGAAVLAFGAHAVKAFMEADRVQRQLNRAAGEYGEALGAQADALERRFNVDGDLIKQSQTLLTQWGGVGAASEEVTQAILDYAAATGIDAVQATEELIRNVESGGTGLAKLGVHFEATGRKGDDLGRAVGALSKKFGGAAQADADSLHGQLTGLSTAFDDLVEDIGGSIAAFAQEYGIVEKLTEAINGMRTAAFGNDSTRYAERAEETNALRESLVKHLEKRKMLLAGIAEIEARGEQAPKSRAEIAHLDENIIKLKEMIRLRNEAGVAASTTPGVKDVGGETNESKRAREAAAAASAKKAEEEREKSLTIAHKEFNAEYARKYQEEQIRGEDAAARESVNIEAARVEALKAEGEALIANQEENAQRQKEIQEGLDKSAEVSIKNAIAQRDRQLEAARQQMEREEQAWANAGNAIGAAMVNSISDQLQRLMNGEDLDAGEVMANIIGDILAVAGQAIGTAVGSAYGGAAGAQLGGAIGGAAGGLAGAGVKALGKAGRSRPRTYHDGGWVEPIDLPRYHSGSWIGSDERQAILQTDERVASRQEVRNAGGREALDAVLAGGGGPRFAITVNTIDSLGTRQFFENDGGRGFFNALRTGRGSLLPAFGGG